MAQPTHAMPEASSEPLSLEEQNSRLLKLVGELLQANQDLRFKVAALERDAKRTERALADASAVYGLL